jgi:PEP-CTERM motif
MKLLKIATIATVLVVGLGMSQAAHADTMWNLATGLTADAAFSASGGTWALTMTFDNTSGFTATVNQFTLALFQPSNATSPYFTIDSGSFAPGTAFFDSKGDNGQSTCAADGTNKGWLCVQFTPAATLGAGSTSFSGSGTYADVSPLDGNTLDLISNGLTNNTDSTSKWAISAAGSPSTSVPEPGTMSMLLLGLLGLVGFAGISRLRKNRSVLVSSFSLD